ncbi:hypothetical protein BLA29_009031, partial [Euroglyphus maynei]
VGQIRLVIGQSRLFINERFKQFSGLVDDCEEKRGEKEIKLEDLAGFWDMINYQIDDLKTKYAELEQLQSNQWQPIEKKPVDRKSSSNQTQPIRKPLQTVINGNRTTTKMNGHNHHHPHHHNDKDTIDGSNEQAIKKAPAKSNFREFLKAKKQEKLATNGKKLNNDNNGDDSVINGHRDNEKITSKNGDHDENIKIMIIVNNNNHDDCNVKKNVKSDDDHNDDHRSSTAENDSVIKGNDNTQNGESNESSPAKSIQVRVN